jgi:hypothetical protein
MISGDDIPICPGSALQAIEAITSNQKLSVVMTSGLIRFML